MTDQYQVNVSRQYEMLGRFVEAFELMVEGVRDVIIFGSTRGSKNATLIETILHNSALTAKPLFDIMRAVVAELIEDTRVPPENRSRPGVQTIPLWTDDDSKAVSVTEAERNVFFGVLSCIATEYDALANKRNDLLHGTWFVGFPSTDDPHSAQFFVRKFKNTKAGLSLAEGLPKDADELKQLAERCTEVRDWLGRIEQCLICELKITDVFRASGGTWIMTDPPGTQRTLKWY